MARCTALLVLLTLAACQHSQVKLAAEIAAAPLSPALLSDPEIEARMVAHREQLALDCFLERGCRLQGDFDGDGVLDLVVTATHKGHCPDEDDADEGPACAQGFVFLLSSGPVEAFGLGVSRGVTLVDNHLNEGGEQIIETSSEVLDADLDHIVSLGVVPPAQTGGPCLGPDPRATFSLPGVRGDALWIDFGDVYGVLYACPQGWCLWDVGA